MIHTDQANPVQMYRAYTFLLRPTSKQADALAACLEDHRQLYNAALEERREAWRMSRTPIQFAGQSAQLPAIRAADPGTHGRWSAGSQQQTLRRLSKAFACFYRRVAAGEKKPGYPRFKSSARFNSVTWAAMNGGARWDSQPHGPATRLYLVGLGHIRVHQHRAVAGRVKMITVRREGRRWYVALQCDNAPARSIPPAPGAVGIDLGIAHLVTTSDGNHVRNPRHFAATAGRLAEAHRGLARKQRGSRRREQAKQRVVSIYAKARRSRLDHAHKVALQLIRDNNLIVHEDLNIRGLTLRPQPKVNKAGFHEPNGAGRKGALNRTILDAAWGVFLRVLSDKAAEAGRTVLAVNPRYTSRRCSRCGHVAAGNRPTQARFRCVACGHEAHADVNAAQNILRAGLALQANAA